MTSEIVQKEKKRQEEYFEIREDIRKNCRTLQRPAWIEGHIASHKISIINLKRYMGSKGWQLIGKFNRELEEYSERTGKGLKSFETPLLAEMKQYEDDIKELDKIIKRYK